MIIGCEVYVKGRKTGAPESVGETHEVSRERGGMAWIGLYEPTGEELESVVEEFGLHPLAVEDAIEAHQRPKVEHYGESLFMVLKSARYVDESESVEFGEIHLFIGEDFVITVRHGEASSLGEVRERLEGDADLLKRGPFAVLYAVLDYVVDGYAPVLDGLENDVDEVEAEVFGGGASSDASKRIYGLSRQVIQFHRATSPLVEALESLVAERKPAQGRNADWKIDREIARYMRDVHDHALRVNDRVEGLREVISNILSVNLAIIGMDQNDQTKKISAWAAILVVPTVITGIYGMNFDFMPELDSPLGYPYALLLMISISLVLYFLFRRRGWL